MSSYSDIFGGAVVNPAWLSYIEISLTSNITLSWPSQFVNTGNVTANIMDIIPNAGGRILTLPDARDVSVGQSILINNPTAFDFTLNKNDGTALATIEATSIQYIYLIDNSTQAGSWRDSLWGEGITAVTSINATSSSNNLVIGGVPITTSGTITFALANDLLALSTFGASTGLAVRTAADTWALRSLTGTANQIVITNPSGVAGAPTFALSPTITGISSLAVGNLSLAVNTIQSTNANGNINFAPNGTGIVTSSSEFRVLAGQKIKWMAPTGTNYFSLQTTTTSDIQDLIWPTVAPLDGQLLGFDTGASLAWFTVTTTGGSTTVNAVARYSNVSGSLKNSNIIVDDSGNITGPLSVTVGSLGIGTITDQTITTLGANENLFLAPNGTGAIVNTGDIWLQPVGAVASIHKFFNPSNTFFAGFRAGAMLSNVTWTWPLTDSTGTQALVSNGSGVLSWASGGGGVSSIIGTAGQITASAATGDVTLSIPSTLVISGAISNAVGSVSAPSYSFTGDLDTGMWHPTANTLGFSTNAQLAMQIEPTPATTVNYLRITASAAGDPIILATDGTDAAVNLRLFPKGTTTGQVVFPLGAEATPSMTFLGDENTGMFSTGGDTIDFSTAGSKVVTIDADGNLGIGVDTFGTNAAATLALSNATPPASGPANTIQIYSSDLSAGNTILSMYNEGNGGISAVSPTAPDRTLAVSVNGVIYYLACKTTND